MDSRPNNQKPSFYSKQNHPSQLFQDQSRQSVKNIYPRHSIQLQNCVSIANSVRRSSVQQNATIFSSIHEKQSSEYEDSEHSISPTQLSDQISHKFAQKVPQFPETFLKLLPTSMNSMRTSAIGSFNKVEEHIRHEKQSAFANQASLNLDLELRRKEEKVIHDDDAQPNPGDFERKSRRSHLFFDFHRANVETSFSYQPEDDDQEKVLPEKVHEENKGFKTTRVSSIQSNFRNNPYHYNMDYDPIPETIEENVNTGKRYQSSVGIDPQLISFFSQGKYFLQFLDHLKETDEVFLDKDFPPSFESLVGRNEGRRVQWGQSIWLRPNEFYGKGRFEIFQGKIEPNDIKQGELGDCYFLATLSSLAEWPHRIQKIFRSKQVNEYGCYCVNICDMGEWKEVLIDDHFPCHQETRKPIFTKGNEKELWVLILEKVWAKMYGSYDAIETGLSRECLHDFTGAPTKFFLTDRKEEWEMIWKKLAKGEAKQYAMTCGAKEFFSSKKLKKVSSKGIVSAHAYSLLAAYEVTHHKRKVRLVKLRNPWGQTEWNGAWSDYSSNWTPKLKHRLGWVSKNDGVFFMAYEDFLKNFTDIQFCYIHDNYLYNSLKVTSDSSHAVYFKLTIKMQGKYYVTVNQESKRKHAENNLFKYSTVYLVLSKIRGADQYHYVSGNNRADREVWTKCVLTPGEYLIYAKVQWNTHLKKDFVLSTYGPGNTEIEVVEKMIYPDFLEKTFISRAKMSSKKVSYAKEGEPNCFSVVDISRDGFIYCYYQNKSLKVLETEVYFKEFNGVKLRKPYRGQNFKLSIPPNQEKIVLVKILPNQDVKQVLSEKVKFLRDESTEGLTTLEKEAKVYGERRRVKDQITGEKKQIYIYQYKHNEGVFFLFQNMTKDEMLDQRIMCELDGLEPVGLETGGREISFKLYPGQSHRIVFQKKNGPKNFEAKFKFESIITKI